MGQNASRYFLPHLWREDEPDSWADIKYHPQFGFEADRKEKVVRATEEEMDSANLEWSFRDNCAHIRLQLNGCVKYNMPWYYKCKGLNHELADCYLGEHVHDMKEFEREKRLNARERKLKEKSLS